MRTIPVLSLLLLGVVSTALAQQRFQPSDSPDVTVTVQSVAPGANLFFAANGNDNNPCTQAAPCQTLSKAASFIYQPGATINFRGGDTFFGEFYLTRTQVPSGGDVNNPITIQSYGGGRATIASNQDGVNNGNKGPRNWAVLLDSTSGVVLQDLNITANGKYVQYGIVIQNLAGTWAPADYNQQLAAGMIHNIVVRRVDVGGFGVRPTPGNWDAFEAGAQLTIAGYFVTSWGCGPIDNVRVLDSKFHGNDGVASLAETGINVTNCLTVWNVVWRGNEVFNIGGTPGVAVSGNGMVMTGVVNGVMEYNHAHHNANNAQGCGGPVGIWADNSKNITIQFNEVDHMHVANWGATGQQCDVGAYDFDSNVFDSVMQYNYSHDNDGPGWLLHGNASNNTVRYNISVNDGLRNGPAAILNINGGGLSRFYNNIAIGPSAAFQLAAYSYKPGSQVANNILITTGLDSAGRWFGGGPLPGADISNKDIRNNLYFNTVPGVAIRFSNNSFQSDGLASTGT